MCSSRSAAHVGGGEWERTGRRGPPQIDGVFSQNQSHAGISARLPCAHCFRKPLPDPQSIPRSTAAHAGGATRVEQRAGAVRAGPAASAAESTVIAQPSPAGHKLSSSGCRPIIHHPPSTIPGRRVPDSFSLHTSPARHPAPSWPHRPPHMLLHRQVAERKPHGEPSMAMASEPKLSSVSFRRRAFAEPQWRSDQGWFRCDCYLTRHDPAGALFCYRSQDAVPVVLL